MNGYIVSPEAEDDLFEIWSYFAREAGTSTANRIESELYEKFGDLSRSPGQGHLRSDLTNLPVLFFPVYQFMIVYRAKTPLEIVAVLHGKRDVQSILKDRPH